MTTTMKARETVYAGIKMRSRLEAGFAAWLDTKASPWEYEPCAFANGSGQYLPDFRVSDVLDVRTCSLQTAYIEVKPFAPDTGFEDLVDLISGQPEDSPNLTALARRMSVIWSSEPDAILLLVWPGMETDRGTCVLRLCRTELEGIPMVFLPTCWLSGSMLAVGSSVSHPNRPWPDGYWNVD